MDCCCGIGASLTTQVRVRHVRKDILTFNMMCNLLHNEAIHLFTQTEVCNVFCVRARDERDEGVCTVAQCGRRTKDFSCRGRTSVWGHFRLTILSQPLSFKSHEIISFHCERAVHDSAEHMLAVKCLSTLFVVSYGGRVFE